jgi:hypothetical protein
VIIAVVVGSVLGRTATLGWQHGVASFLPALHGIRGGRRDRKKVTSQEVIRYCNAAVIAAAIPLDKWRRFCQNDSVKQSLNRA